MNPKHSQDLPLDLNSLFIIIHYDTSCPTDLRQITDSGQQNTTKLHNDVDSSTEKVQHQEQEPIAQNEADAWISCSEDESTIDDTVQNHKQEAQLCEPTELTESAKKELRKLRSRLSKAKARRWKPQLYSFQAKIKLQNRLRNSNN